MKKVISALLTILLCFAFSGCGNGGFKEPTYEGNSQEPTLPVGILELPDPTDAPTEAPTEISTESPTDPPFDPTDLVTDAYSYSSGERIFRIPQINLSSYEIDAINEEIYGDYYEDIMQDTVLPDMGNSPCYKMGYDWYYSDGVLSLLVYSLWDGDNIYYDVYNVSVTDGKELSDRSVILSKMTIDSYKSLIKDTLDAAYTGKHGEPTDEFSYTQYRKTVSDDNIDDCKPYLGENGDLYVIAAIYSLAGAEKYYYQIKVGN